MNRAAPSLACLLFLASLAAAQEEDGPRPRVVVSLSVDWEGRDLSEENLRAFEAFRGALPGVPLTHFLSGAYYTKPGVQPDRVTAAIRRAFRAGDETGHHVHVWRSLVEAAGVTFREGPTFWGDGRPLHPAADGDLGHEVEVPSYTTEEIRAIVREGVRRLRANGFEVGESFRAGGWIAEARVLEAIRAEGFTVDASAVDAEWHRSLRGLRLPRRIREVWPELGRRTQPFSIETAAGEVIEVPDSGALADYVTPQQMIEHLHDALERARANPSEPVFVSLGFHQETAARYAGRLRQALEAFHGEAALEFVTVGEAARQARVRGVPRRSALPPRTGLPLDPERASRSVVDRLSAPGGRGFAARQQGPLDRVGRTLSQTTLGAMGVLGRLRGLPERALRREVVRRRGRR